MTASPDNSTKPVECEYAGEPDRCVDIMCGSCRTAVERRIAEWHREQAMNHRATAEDMRASGQMSMAANVDIVAETHERAADAIERDEHRG